MNRRTGGAGCMCDDNPRHRCWAVDVYGGEATAAVEALDAYDSTEAERIAASFAPPGGGWTPKQRSSLPALSVEERARAAEAMAIQEAQRTMYENGMQLTFGFLYPISELLEWIIEALCAAGRALRWLASPSYRRARAAPRQRA